MENHHSPFETDQYGAVYPILLGADLTKILAKASLAAYEQFDNSAHPNQISSGGMSFTYVDTFTGFDDWFAGSGSEENYGLIYRMDSQPGTLLIAFRGTDSTGDAIIDLESIIPVEFKPHKPPTGFPLVHVGDGFYSTYTEKGLGMTGSMREQLFSKLARYPHDHLIITGHSLGCALGSLFALDVAASQPTQITNINFASPRIGTQSWLNAYEHYVTNSWTPNGRRNWTIRIANHYDEVPDLPPSGFPTYFQHVGHVFPVSFTTQLPHDFDPYKVYSWHSLLNYQTVVDHAVVSTPQGWAGVFADAAVKGWQMVSYNPFTTRTAPVSERYGLGEAKKTCST